MTQAPVPPPKTPKPPPVMIDLPRDHAVIYGTPEGVAAARDAGPLTLGPGPHLFIDDYLVESAQGVARVVNQPQRDLPGPIIDGPTDRAFQPFFTVLQDPQTGTFRTWYGAARDDKSTDGQLLGYMESPDGIHWQRPMRALERPEELQFGSDVLDAGPDCPDPAQRYTWCWCARDGAHISTSADGLNFRPLSPKAFVPHGHDVCGLWWDPIRSRYMLTVGDHYFLPHMTERRRTASHGFSEDLLHWTDKQIVVVSDNRYDKDILQFYAMNGYIARGDLVIGLVKNLHDDWKAPGAPEGAYGVGSTSLAWTRDGQTWVRDREVFFGPDPVAGAWDHAHAWIDKQLLLGDEVRLYYCGYKWGHKHNRFEERQIGLVRMQRDRYVARQAGGQAGVLRTPPVVLSGKGLTINAKVDGELAVRLLDAQDRPLAGCDWTAIQGDRVDHPVTWDGKLGASAGRPVRLEWRLRDAQLFGFDLLA